MRIRERITLDPNVLGGKPCIRGLRITAATLLGLLGFGHSEEEILSAYPYNALRGRSARVAGMPSGDLLLQTPRDFVH
ncbi:MAG: DUF433 domain-containing protein [Holophagales bacterium]|nr:DUF433 domain-containing protein [Holophagales bacterium]